MRQPRLFLDADGVLADFDLGARQLLGMRPKEFIAKHASHTLDAAERVRALSLMEMARHAMLMYTSCGWFFDELSGIETVQWMQ